MGVEQTVSYTQGHIYNVRKLLNKFADVLKQKGETHDQSKLEEPEVYGWAAMDLEPRYEYGSYEYYDKLRRFSEVFNHHYKVNSHHPEHFVNPEHEMTLIDMVEMLCDWFAYKQDIPIREGVELIREQCDRFGFSDTIMSLLTNTYREYINSDLFNDIYANQERIIADKQMENSHNYLLWERAFKPKNDEEEILDSGIDFSNLFPWERKSK